MFKNQIHFVPILYGANINRIFKKPNLFGMSLDKDNIEWGLKLHFIWIEILKYFYFFEIFIVVGKPKQHLCQLNTVPFATHLVNLVG